MPTSATSARNVSAAAAVAGILAVGVTAQAQADLSDMLARVGNRIAEFYRRAQTVVCIEKSTVQPIGWNLSPQGFARVVESELRVEMEPGETDGAPEATFVRKVRKVNGRPPRERDKTDRAGCTDPNPVSTEPIAFLLPGHRSEYQFTAAGTGRDRNRTAVLIDFRSITRASRLELNEDASGHDDCFGWSGDVAVSGRIWVDAGSYDVIRVDRRIRGPVEIKVPLALQRRHNMPVWMTIDRDDLTIRYKSVAFREPDELVLVPDSIESLTIVRGGLESTRRTQTYADFRRFITGGRIVKER